mgnify:CR=1 FL=1
MNALINKIKNNDIFKAVASLFGANMFGSIVGMIGSFVQGRFITADELGFFKQFSIITGYLFFFHFGVFHAVERLYPLYMSRGEEDKARRVVEVANAWILLVCFPITIVFAVLSVICFVTGEWKSGLCWIVEIISIWAALYGGFLSATYRSGKEFQSMAKANVANPIVSCLLIPFYWIQPFVTMILRNCTSAISTARLYLSRPVKVKFRFNFKEWIDLVKQGLPLFSASYITTTGLDAIRGTLILIFLSQEQLGYWSFAYTCILLVLQLPTSITAVYAPRIVSEYAKTERTSDCFKMCKKPILMGGAVMLCLVPLGIACVHFLLPLILPNYVGATATIYVLLLSVPLKLSDALSQVLVAAKRVAALNVISLVSTAVQVLVSLLLAYIGVGIISFAIGFLCGYLVRTVCLLGNILSNIKKEKGEPCYNG